MTFLNNLIHNDYVFFPLYVGMFGFIGYAWWSEGTKVFTNVTSSPVESWPWHPSSDRVTDASLIEQGITHQRLMKIQNQVNSDDSILNALKETRESTSAILKKLEELKSMKEGTQQIQSITDTNLMIPQTQVPIDTEALNFIAQQTQSIAKTTESISDMANFWFA